MTTTSTGTGETGLDYFGARYFSAALGRLTSPDPPVLDQNRWNPQSWNLYTYSRNNPLRFVDPTGNVVELLGDEEQRKKELALIQRGVNKDVALRLSIKVVKDGDTSHCVLAISGNVGDFKRSSGTAQELADLVEHKSTVD